MIPKECKRLAEVDFPIAVVSKHSAREKSIRHGHPSTLHLWWARRPLAACRAMLMALLLPDPCDPACPPTFNDQAREILLNKHGRPARWKKDMSSPEGLRKTLLEFIGDLANWDNAANMDYLSVARALVKAAHPEETPLVVDPFAGGGSIPLEALRLGCEAFASDLNPVACLILKVMLEDIPRHGPELAEELRRVGGEIKRQAEKELAEFYPKDPDGATPIAYLWARTVKCESPNCGAEIPLMRSFWLCKKADRRRALKLKVVRPEVGPPHVEFEIFEPKTDKDVRGGTVTRAKATCPCCNMVLSPERVRAQLSEQRGGADAVFDANGNRSGGARMVAVVTLNPGIQGRKYRLSIGRDYQAVWKAQKRLKAILNEWERGGKEGLCPIPDELRPPSSADRVRPYGMLSFSDLTTCRQRSSLSWLANQCKKFNQTNVGRLTAAILGRCADYWSSGARWVSGGEFVAGTFSLQVIPIGWDFPEIAPWADGSGNFDGAIDWVARVVESLPKGMADGQVQLADARTTPLPEQTASIWFTDPPYYDAVRYADLSDSFFVWIKRSMMGSEMIKDPFDPHNPLTPKCAEIVQDEKKQFQGKAKNRGFFETAMAQVFVSGRRVLREDGVGSVVFAHKTTEGWEALLTGMVQGGWTITSSWPIATERPGRMRSLDSAALATSVHLICRPRPEDAPVGDWGDVLRELPKRVGDWMERLQGEGVRGADLVFACIGPALEIFSRYRMVETADGREVKLAEYLEKVWEVVGRTALEQVLGTAEARARNGMAGALEEDARLTALFLWTLQATNGQNGSGSKATQDEDSEEDSGDDEEASPKGKTKGYSLVFDVARRFAQPLGIEMPKWEGRIIETKKGVVRLMAVSERAKQLFGAEGVETATDWIETAETGKPVQLRIFPEEPKQDAIKIQGRKRGQSMVSFSGENTVSAGATTLDRVHAAMLLQAGGQANGLRMLIKSEQDRSPDFLRLANALSALYPKGSEEKRLLDAMLLAVPR
jgi:putative DNA methylase